MLNSNPFHGTLAKLAKALCPWSLSCSIIIIIHALCISAAASLIITLPRIIDADWSTPLGYGYLAIFVKNPASVVNYQVYLEPMTYLAWGMVVVFLIVIPPFLYIVFVLNPNPHDNMSLAQSYGVVFVAMISLGSPDDPKNVSTRIIFLR